MAVASEQIWSYLKENVLDQERLHFDNVERRNE